MQSIIRNRARVLLNTSNSVHLHSSLNMLGRLDKMIFDREVKLSTASLSPSKSISGTEKAIIWCDSNRKIGECEIALVSLSIS